MQALAQRVSSAKICIDGKTHASINEGILAYLCFEAGDEEEVIDKFISKIVRNLEGLGENEIKTATIGKVIMNELASLDQVAYVRFASVYKKFKEAKDFEDFVGNLNVYKKE